MIRKQCLSAIDTVQYRGGGLEGIKYGIYKLRRRNIHFVGRMLHLLFLSMGRGFICHRKYLQARPYLIG